MGALAAGDAGGVIYAATRSSSFISLLLVPSSSSEYDGSGGAEPTRAPRTGEKGVCSGGAVAGGT